MYAPNAFNYYIADTAHFISRLEKNCMMKLMPPLRSSTWALGAGKVKSKGSSIFLVNVGHNVLLSTFDAKPRNY